MRITLAIIISALLTIGARSYFGGTQEYPEDTPILTEAVTQDLKKPEQRNPAPETDSSTEETFTKNTPETQENADLPHWTSAFDIYQVPSENLSEEVQTILESFKNDSSGEPEFKIFRISVYCDMAPKNEGELLDRKHLYEEASLMSGQDNGQTLENINRAVTHYEECKELAEQDLLAAYDYLEASAAKGNPNAKTVLATAISPNGFDAWPEDTKDEYRRSMETHLEDARASCEPRAFYAYAHGLGENDTWVDTSDIPRHIRKYSNLLARGMIYANKAHGSERIQSSIRDNLRSLASAIGEYGAAEAEKYGRHLYKESCD